MIYSWYISYPLTISSLNDRVFNHISPLYWVGLPLFLTSMLMIAFTSNNNYLKWIMTVGIVVTLYSISYFYFMMPTPDSQYFRGSNEYLMKTQNLDFSASKIIYFQWPFFFIFTNIAASITGLHLPNLEFLGYATVAFIMCSSMYIYSSKLFKNGGYLLVIAFYLAMNAYLNFQYVPFSLSFSLLFLLFMLDTGKRTAGSLLLMLVIFISMVFMHAFVPLFFILYSLVRYIISRDKYHGLLFLNCSILFLFLQFTYAQFSLITNLLNVSRLSSEFVAQISPTIKVVYFPIDAIAQKFLIMELIVIISLSLVGFFFLFAKRKLRDIDKAILLSGLLYSASGFLIYSLSSRAIALTFLPISLGIPFIFTTRFKSFLKGILLVLLIFFTFIPIHGAFYNQIISYQTEEAYVADNFFIDHNDYSKHAVVLASFYTRDYLQTRTGAFGNIEIDTPYDSGLESWQIKRINTVVYNLALQNELDQFNSTIKTVLYEEKINVVYNNGFSKILMKSYDSAMLP